MSIQENKAKVREYLDELYRKGNLEILDKLTVPDVIVHHPDISGIGELKKFVAAYHSMFEGLTFTVADLIAEDDKVASIWSASGTHTGEYEGVAPTGKQVIFTGVAIYRFTGDKVKEMWGWRDALGLLQQLGASPQSK